MTELVFTNLFLPTLAAFGIGIVGALLGLAAFRPTRSMLLTCSFLPPLVCSCLLAVNGSVGTSIAVLGVFGLVRFRSLPAKGTDMICIIYSMVTGLLCACGASLAALALCIGMDLCMLLAAWIFSRRSLMQIQIVVPESMPNEAVYTDILSRFGKKVHLEKMKTAGMGTLYELSYTFLPNSHFESTRLLNEIRAENGNLSVTLLDLHDGGEQL